MNLFSAHESSIYFITKCKYLEQFLSISTILRALNNFISKLSQISGTYDANFKLNVKLKIKKIYFIFSTYIIKLQVLHVINHEI